MKPLPKGSSFNKGLDKKPKPLPSAVPTYKPWKPGQPYKPAQPAKITMAKPKATPAATVKSFKPKKVR